MVLWVVLAKVHPREVVLVLVLSMVVDLLVSVMELVQPLRLLHVIRVMPSLLLVAQQGLLLQVHRG